MTVSVLHVLESLTPGAGNVGVSVAGLVACAAQRGWIVRVAADDASGQDADSPIPAACSVRDTRDLRLKEYDLVHIHGFDYPSACAAAARADSAGIPYVISPLGDFGPGHNRRSVRDRLNWLFRERRLVRRAEFLGACNPAEHDLLIASGIHGDVRLLPYGLDFTRYGPKKAESSPSAGGGRLLLMGPMGPQSGCVALLKAVAELGSEADGWKILLAGDASEAWRKAIETGVRRKGAADRVQWRQASSPAAQEQLLAEADVFVSACEHPCPSIGMLQALAAGVPVVSTAATAIPEMNGHIVECGPGRAGLRDGLRSFLQMSPADRRAQAAKARSYAERTLDWSVLAEQWYREYESTSQQAPSLTS